jgi:hypothetical protein
METVSLRGLRQEVKFVYSALKHLVNLMGFNKSYVER